MVVQDVVSRALRLIGIRNASTDRNNEAFIAFNMMLASWDSIFSAYPVIEQFDISSGTESLTIGSTGDLFTTRPDRIISADLMSDDDISTTLNVLFTYEEFQRIRDKTSIKRPENMCYLLTDPDGTIYFDYIPDQDYTLTIQSYKDIPQYVTLNDTIAESAVYQKAYAYNLAIDLADEWDMQPLNHVTKTAEKLKDELSNNNMRAIPSVQNDPVLMRRHNALRW